MANAPLYGAVGGSNNTSNLFTINPVTGAITVIGPIGYAITGLVYDPTTETLFGSTSANSAADPFSLISIDRDTGDGTLIGSTGLANPVGDIACDASGNLWGWRAGNNSCLVSIDKLTGVATTIGATGFFGGVVEFVGNALYWFPRSTGGFVSVVNLATGALVQIVVMTGSNPLSSGSSYHDGTMYLCGNGRLFSVDLLTGVVTQECTIPAAPAIDAIAWGPEPPPFTGRVFADLPVRTIVTDINSETVALLDHRATNRQFLFTLNGPAYHTGQVASDDVEINRPFPDPDSPAAVSNNLRFIFALQRWQGYSPPYQPIFSGILMTPEDTGADAPTTRYTAYDPWQYLMSRPARNPASATIAPTAIVGTGGYQYEANTRASDIALDQLGMTEIWDGETFIDTSDSGLLEPTDPFTVPFVINEGMTVGEVWTALCETGTIDIHLDPMYEPITAPGKLCRLRFVAQRTGQAAGPVRYDAVMGWDKAGKSLAEISRMVDGTRLANKVQFFAGEGGVPAPAQTDAGSISAYGVYWALQFFPDSHDRTLVALAAVAELATRRYGAKSISFSPAPERSAMPLRDYGLGDYLPVLASRNLREPLDIDYLGFDADNPGAAGYQRVYAIPLDVDDDGVTHVRGIVTVKENQ